MRRLPLSFLQDARPTDPAEQARFNQRLEVMMQAMHLHGLRGKAIDRYRCTLYNIAGDLGRCLDELQPYVLKEYFSRILEQYSWSTIKGDLSSLQPPVRSSLCAESGR
jgi:hypothetical protein